MPPLASAQSAIGVVDSSIVIASGFTAWLLDVDWMLVVMTMTQQPLQIASSSSNSSEWMRIEIPNYGCTEYCLGASVGDAGAGLFLAGGYDGSWPTFSGTGFIFHGTVPVWLVGYGWLVDIVLAGCGGF